MKRFTVLLSVVCVLALMGFAQAGGDGKCGATKTADAGKTCGSAAVQTASTGDCAAKATAAVANASMHPCCVDAAKAHQGCCGMDAAAVEAKYVDMRATEVALKSMHECCAAAVAADKGCCGKDAAALKADFATHVVDAKAEVAALDGMHPCCAQAVQAEQGLLRQGRDGAEGLLYREGHGRQGQAGQCGRRLQQAVRGCRRGGVLRRQGAEGDPDQGGQHQELGQLEARTARSSES